jgi:hypothetical protein
MKKDKIGEYDDFANRDFGFEEKEEQFKRQEEDMDTCIKHELFNFKIERLVGIEKEKRIFDEKYKESLLTYINNSSFKDKRNTGTIIGEFI